MKQYHVVPDLRALAAYGLSFHDVLTALERNNLSTGAGYVEHNGEVYVVRAAGRRRRAPTSSPTSSSSSATGVPIRIARRRDGRARPRARAPAAPARTARRSCSARRSCWSAPTAGRSRRPSARDWPRSTEPAARTSARKTVLDRSALVDATIATVATQPRRGRAARRRGALPHARQLARGAHHRARDPALDAADRDRHGADARPAAIS